MNLLSYLHLLMATGDVAHMSHGGDCGGDPPGGGGGWQPPNRCLASVEKSVRGRTRNKGLKAKMKGLPKDSKLSIDFEKNSKGTFIAVGVNSNRFNTLLGTIVSRIPYYYASWNEIPQEHKSTMWLELEHYFNLEDYLYHEPPTDVEAGISLYCGRLYKGQKWRFGKKWFDNRGGKDNLEELKVSPPPDMPTTEWEKTSEAFQSRSTANKGCRSKQKIKVRQGRKNMAQMRFENRASPIDEYRRLRIKKGVFTEPEAEELYNEMIEMRNNRPSHGMTDDEIVTHVLGDRRGWSRGIGQKLPKSVYVSSSSSSSKKRTYSQREVNDMLAKVRSEIGPIKKALKMAGIKIPSTSTVDEDEDEDEDDGEGEGEGEDEDEEDETDGEDEDDYE